MEVFLIYPVFIGIGIATAELARDKGYKGRWWFLASLVIPLLPTFILLGLKARKQKAVKELIIAPTHHDKILYQKTA